MYVVNVVYNIIGDDSDPSGLRGPIRGLPRGSEGKMGEVRELFASWAPLQDS